VLRPAADPTVIPYPSATWPVSREGLERMRPGRPNVRRDWTRPGVSNIVPYSRSSELQELIQAVLTAGNRRSAGRTDRMRVGSATAAAGG